MLMPHVHIGTGGRSAGGGSCEHPFDAPSALLCSGSMRKTRPSVMDIPSEHLAGGGAGGISSCVGATTRRSHRIALQWQHQEDQIRSHTLDVSPEYYWVEEPAKTAACTRSLLSAQCFAADQRCPCLCQSLHIAPGDHVKCAETGAFNGASNTRQDVQKHACLASLTTTRQLPSLKNTVAKPVAWP